MFSQYPTTMKTHYHGQHGRQMLFCSGRSVEFTFTTSILDEVTCKACRRKLVKEAINVPA